LNRQIATAGVEAFAFGNPRFEVMAADPLRSIAPNDYSADILTALGVLVLPSVELRVGFSVSPNPLISLCLSEHEAVGIPCGLHKTGCALAIDCAKIHWLRAAAILVGYVFEPFAGHARRSDFMEV
jgi:hypothetical protein